VPDTKASSKNAPTTTAKTDLHQQALEQGYFGTSPKSIPNEQFSLKTGPDSPSAASQIVEARRGQVAVAEASLTNNPEKG
jgi:hypothetical protein